MDDYSEEQIDQIRESRQKKFEKMGIPSPVSTPQELQQMVGSTGKNSSARDRINAIKNGSRKSEITQFVHVKTKSEQNQEFDRMVENRTKTSQRPNPQQKNVPKVAVPPLQSFAPQGDVAEARGIESMFDDGPGYSSEGVVMGNQWNERKQNSMEGQIVPENYGAGGDWEDSFKQRVAPHKKGAQSSEYMQYASNSVVAPDYITESHNSASIEKMISEAVDKKIGIILSEVIRMQQKQTIKEDVLTYKTVKNKKGETLKNMVQIDGKFYKLEEFIIKK